MGIPAGYGQYSLPTMGGEQKDIYNLLKGQFQQGAPDIYQKLFGMAQGQGDIFKQLEAGPRRDLNTQLGQIGSQFGLSGTNKSSGFQNAISGAGQSFAENLYGQRANLMQKSMQDVLGLGNMLFAQPTEQFGLFEKPNIWRDLLHLLGSVGSQAASTLGTSKLLG